MRACPVSERCFALESSSRVLSLTVAVASAAAPAAYKAKVVEGKSIESRCTATVLRQYDSSISTHENPATGRHQLPGDQPRPAALADAIRRLARADRAAAGARSVD